MTWQEIIDGKLTEWGRDPGRTDEDDLVWPTTAAVTQAKHLAILCRESHRWPPPQRVTPDGDGGIVFERWSESRVLETIAVDEYGGVCFTRFEDGQIREQRVLYW